MKIAVTGSAGFIGGYIVEEALSRDIEVIGIDNFSKYGEPVRSFASDSKFHQLVGDASDAAFLEGIFKDVDHVIAGAAMIGGITYFHTYQYDLLSTNERIIAGTCDAAIKAHRNGNLKKLTYLSSSMVFESTSKFPSKEGDELFCPPPKSSYGFQKLSGEYFVRAAWDQYHLPYTILRPFNCIGIGERKMKNGASVNSGNISLIMSHVLPDLVQKILRGQNPIEILGDGSQTRCYTYGGDLAKGIIDSLAHPDAINEDFNLSNSTPTTVLELAEKVWHFISGNEREFRYVSLPEYPNDVKLRLPDIKKAEHILGFKATTSIDEVLQEVIPWIKEAIMLDQI